MHPFSPRTYPLREDILGDIQPERHSSTGAKMRGFARATSGNTDCSSAIENQPMAVRCSGPIKRRARHMSFEAAD
jgi:hypothetical protein